MVRGRLSATAFHAFGAAVVLAGSLVGVASGTTAAPAQRAPTPRPPSVVWRTQALSERVTIETPGELVRQDVGEMNSAIHKQAPTEPGRITKFYLRADTALSIIVGCIEGFDGSEFDAGDRLQGGVDRIRGNSAPDLRYQIRRQGASHATFTGSSVVHGLSMHWAGFVVLDGDEGWMVITISDASKAAAAANARRVLDSFELVPRR